MKKKNNFVKRSAASIAAMLIVAGANPVTSYLGFRSAAPIVASAAKWDVEASTENVYSLATNKPSTISFNFKSNDENIEAANICTKTNGFKFDATDVVKEDTDKEGEFKYTVTGDLTVIKGSNGNYGNRDWVYFYYTANNTETFIDRWVFDVYDYQEYSVNKDNSAILDMMDEKRVAGETEQSLVEYNDSVLQLIVGNSVYTPNESQQISDTVKYTKNMTICADVNEISNENKLRFDGSIGNNAAKMEIFRVDDEGNVIEEVPYASKFDNTYMNFQPTKVGKYSIVATVVANHIYNPDTKKIETKEYKLVKNFEIVPTDIDAEDTVSEFNFYITDQRHNGNDYKLTSGTTLEVPYSNRVYSLTGYYNSYEYYINVNNRRLEEGVDYEIVGVTASKKTGEHTFKVEFLNGYKGEKEYTWKISDYSDTPTINLAEKFVYGATIAPTVNGNTWDGEVTFEYKGINDDEYTTEVPTEIGEYQVRAVIGAANGHESIVSKEKSFSITQYSFWVGCQNTTITYGDEIPELTWNSNADKNIIPEFEVEIWDGNTKIDPAVDKLQAKNYTLKPVAIDDTTHYNISYHNATLYVNPKEVTAKDVTLTRIANLYTGKYQSPEYYITIDGEEATFNVSGQKRAKNIGNYTTEIELTGNYSGYIESEWAIEDKKIDTGLAMDINGIVESNKQVKFILSRTVSEAKAIESGFIYSKTGADITGIKYDDTTAIDDKNIKKRSTPVGSNDGNVTFTITDEGKGINIVGYVVYHTASGDFVEYTPVKSVTFEQAVNEKVSSGLAIAPVEVKSGDKVKFRVSRQAENMTVLESGFIYSKTGADIKDVTIGSSKIDGKNIKSIGSDNNGNNTSLTFTITDTGKGINVIGYIKYETSNGIQYEYTDVLSTTYADADAALSNK